jgi:hypothetical protein
MSSSKWTREEKVRFVILLVLALIIMSVFSLVPS